MVGRLEARRARIRGMRALGGWCLSECPDALGLGAILALADLELDALSLVQRPEAVALDLRVVHEDVSAATVLLDEPEALLAVEPLHFALQHILL